MAHSTLRTTDVGIYDTVREYSRRRTALGGMLAWTEVAMTEIIGSELRIICKERPTKVFLNGVEFISTQPAV